LIVPAQTEAEWKIKGPENRRATPGDHRLKRATITRFANDP